MTEQKKVIKELEKLDIKFIKRIESKPPRLQFSYNKNHPLDVYTEEGRQIREKLVALAETTKPTYVYHSATKTIEVTIS